MPELPEVETIVRDLAPRITGKQIDGVNVLRPDVLRSVSTRTLIGRLTGSTVTSLSRRAKHAVFLLDSGYRMVIQPRMTGVLLYLNGTSPSPDADPRYHVLTARIGDGTFVYRDVRRLGTIQLLDPAGWETYNARIGPEPLDRSFTAKRFRIRLAGTRQAIKKALMDQRRVAGIGNIYANEALFLAGIDPARPAGDLTAAELARLLRETKKILRHAIRARGTTLRDYRTGTGGRGSFQDALRVYGRGGAECVNCKSELITTHAIDGRQTTFCPSCQN